MKSLRHLALYGLLCCGGCDADVTPPGAAPSPVKGARIDGSEDGPVPAAGGGAVSPGETAAETSASDGALPITYRDLSLVGCDVDTMLDYLLFPEEYEGQEIPEIDLPERVTELAGREVSIVGYMIPGELDGGQVRDFMLVRDLASCCFGGSPQPDEWIDVVMVEGEAAEYHPYLPTRARGVLRIAGEQDEVGFALGIYHLEAESVVVEE